MLDLSNVSFPSSVDFLLNATSSSLQQIPGSPIVIRYIQSSYQNDPIRSLIELVLCLFAIRYLIKPRKRSAKDGYVKLTDIEIDELIDDWVPEPLVAKMTPFEEAETERIPTILGPAGPKVKLTNGKQVINLASYNYYNLNANEHLKEKAIQTLRNYGVGPCGPPNFYGTQDVHMKVEADIAAHIGHESALLYAQAFSVSSSVIPAFLKRGDIIVADTACNFAIRRGIEISRATIKWYEHNDMEDLESHLKNVVREGAKKKLTRRVIITEGLFEDVGDMTDLPALVTLAQKYKFRIILDETWSYGVLGRTGRGLTEYLNVDPTQVDMIIGSLAGPLCSAGGFCAGHVPAIKHQRLQAAAFVYSAALPAISATTASEAIALIASTPELLNSTRDNIKVMWSQLDPKSEYMHCLSCEENPMMLLVLKPEIVQNKKLSYDDEQELLQEIVDEALANGVWITRRKDIQLATLKEVKLQPALKICVTNGLTKKEVEKAGTVIRHAITKCVKARRKE